MAGSEYCQHVIKEVEGRRAKVEAERARVNLQLDGIGKALVTDRVELAQQLEGLDAQLRLLDKDLVDARAALKEAEEEEAATAAKVPPLQAEGWKLFARLEKDFPVLEKDVAALVEVEAKLAAVHGYIPWLLPGALVRGLKDARSAWSLAQAIKGMQTSGRSQK